MFEMLSPWKEQAQKLKCGEITKSEYDDWRYNYSIKKKQTKEKGVTDYKNQ